MTLLHLLFCVCSSPRVSALLLLLHSRHHSRKLIVNLVSFSHDLVLNHVRPDVDWKVERELLGGNPCIATAAAHKGAVTSGPASC